MNIWVKRYLLLTICLAIAVFPTILILNQSNIFSNEKNRTIALIIIGIIAILYYVIMTILMLRKKGDK